MTKKKEEKKENEKRALHNVYEYSLKVKKMFNVLVLQYSVELPQKTQQMTLRQITEL